MLEVHPVSEAMRLFEEGPAPDLEGALRERVDAVWQAEQAASGGRLFDGRMFCLTERRGADLVGCFQPFRRFLAQQREPDLFADLGLRPLAVSGLVILGEAVVFGLRGPGLTTDQGMWETIASGGIDEGARRDDGSIDYVEQFRREMVEEVNVDAAWIADAAPFALVEDPATHVHDIAVEARLTCSADDLMARFGARDNEEYSDLAIVDPAGMAAFLAGNGHRFVAVSLALLRARGLTGGA